MSPEPQTPHSQPPNPDGPGLTGPDTVFGLPPDPENASIVLIPAPFETTTSYRTGTADGPEAIRAASAQVDLLDRRFGRIYERGILMPEADPAIRTASDTARPLAEAIIEEGGRPASDDPRLEEVNTICIRTHNLLYDRARQILERGRTPGLVGGEHSLSYGPIRACAEQHGPIGVLQIDAHMDLRAAYEGFEHSHASIMHNVLRDVPQVKRIVQVGIRDFGEGELETAERAGDRVVTFFDDDWADALATGTTLGTLCQRVVDALPDRVYVTFDIDGLDPALCPHTGTPVPGGLGFREVSILLNTLHRSGRRVVGFDLVEVAPGPNADPDAGGDEPEWDANVGARILYRLCGLAGRAERRET